jgi:hypothetical protein
MSSPPESTQAIDGSAISPEDLAQRYVADQRLIWFMWGERKLNNKLYQFPPGGLVSDSQSRAHVWSDIRPREQEFGTAAPKESLDAMIVANLRISLVWRWAVFKYPYLLTRYSFGAGPIPLYTNFWTRRQHSPRAKLSLTSVV